MKKNFHIDNNLFAKPLQLGSVNLVQLGRLYCEPGEIIGEHYHDNLYELTVITGGKGLLYNGKKQYFIKSGDIHFAFDNLMHKIVSDKDEPLKYDYFAFTLNDEKLQNKYSSLANFLREDGVLFNNETAKTLVFNMIAEVLNGDEYSSDILTSSATQIALITLRELSGVKISKKKLYPQSAEILCYQIMNYINTQLTTINSLKEIADELSYNYSYLSDVFKTTTGISIQNYFLTAKLKLANDLLQNENLSVTEIAEKLNFSSIYSFSRAFKNKYGYSPQTVKTAKSTDIAIKETN